MLEILIMLGVAYFAFNMGRVFQLFEIRKTLHKIAKENNVDLNGLLNAATDEELAENNIVLIKTEIVDDTILLYNLSTNEFLGQASTIEEAAKVFHTRKQNAKGAVVYDNNELFFVDGKISKTL
jgi:hypothetical protein